MKKSILVLFTSLITLSAIAQTDGEGPTLFQSIFGEERGVVVRKFIPLDSIKDIGFNKVYGEFELAQKDLAKKKYNLLNSYIENYYEINDEKADQLMKEALSIRKQEVKVMNKYYKKMSKSCGGKVAAQFYQIENYFSNTITLAITESIPFVGELD